MPPIEYDLPPDPIDYDDSDDLPIEGEGGEL
jgi:hypothetical protein